MTAGATARAGKIRRPRGKTALGAVLIALLGMGLWGRPEWQNASYDLAWRFSDRAAQRVAGSETTLITLENEDWTNFGVPRGTPVRGRLAGLINRLADDGVRLVVLDMTLDQTNVAAADNADLARALDRLPLLVVGADVRVTAGAGVVDTQWVDPDPRLRIPEACWGDIRYFPPGANPIARRHWPFATHPGVDRPTLAQQAARGLHPGDLGVYPPEAWLRYYGERGPCNRFSFHAALDQPAHSFSNQVVFIGNGLNSTTWGDREDDKFLNPYADFAAAGWGVVPGVQLHVTEFLNLAHGEWLRRPPAWGEWSLLLGLGWGLPLGLRRFRWWSAGLVTGVAVGVVALVGIGLPYYTNFWFGWLVVAGGQLPAAWAWSRIERHWEKRQRKLGFTATQPGNAPLPRGALPGEPGGTAALVRQWGDLLPLPAAAAGPSVPEIPNYHVYELLGRGGFGEVWLARNAIGQWQAIKWLQPRTDGSHYGRLEFDGLRRYKPVSERHAGLLRVELVSDPTPAGSFYYVMELADPVAPGWEGKPGAYRPLDLAAYCARQPDCRLPLGECATIGLGLAEALQFLHRNRLIHRDIKPPNVIFVNGRPKLADIGLVSEARTASQPSLRVGTPGYLPPSDEPTGTVAADIYAFGMLLYVTRTGRSPTLWPEIAATLPGVAEGPAAGRFDAVILRACQVDPARRHASAAELRQDLLAVQKLLPESARPPHPGTQTGTQTG